MVAGNGTKRNIPNEDTERGKGREKDKDIAQQVRTRESIQRATGNKPDGQDWEERPPDGAGTRSVDARFIRGGCERDRRVGHAGGNLS